MKNPSRHSRGQIYKLIILHKILCNDTKMDIWKLFENSIIGHKYSYILCINYAMIMKFMTSMHLFNKFICYQRVDRS